MPSRAEIQTEIDRRRTTAQDVIRREYLKALALRTGRDTIVYASGAFHRKAQQGVPAWTMSINTEDIQGFMAAAHGLKGQESLDLVLHSPGGSVEAAEQIVNYLRSKYRHIRALIPQNAMSAATMIACACDEIVMGRQSALGPIDPQLKLPTPNGSEMQIAAHAVLSEFEQAKAEVKADPTAAPLWVGKIKQYPPGILSLCRTATDLAKEKVEAWLGKYMLKDLPDRDSKAEAIAEWLGTADFHKSHGHPINCELAREHGLNVKALEDDQETQDLLLSILHATAITFETTNCVKFVENHKGKGWYLQVATKQAPC